MEAPHPPLLMEQRITEPKQPEPTPMSAKKKVALVGLALLFVAINIDGIARRFRKRVHFSVASVQQLAYPRCGDAADSTANSEGEVVVSTRMSALPTAIERGAWERFRLSVRGCHRVLQVHRETPREVVDAEVVMDSQNNALRAWRRIGSPSPSGIRYDTRVYEFRTAVVTVTRRAADGTISFEEIRPKQKPTIVLAPGVGAMTMWAQQAQLRVNERSQAWVLDLREPLERAWQSTLRRSEDISGESVGISDRTTVRVYSLDEESFFADGDNRIVGDLGGMRENVQLDFPEVEGQTPPNPREPLVAAGTPGTPSTPGTPGTP